MLQLTITGNLLAQLHARTILLRYNSPEPTSGTYGWLKEGQQIKLTRPIVIEQNVGLFGGPYVPMIGGRKTSGLATVGAFTYSYSALPDQLEVGRYCSISRGLRFIDSSHPLNTLTTSAYLFRPKNNLYKEFQPKSVLDFAKKYQPSATTYPKIANDVWIGDNVTLSTKINIGTGAVIASNSTVTKDVPDYAIVGGNPAKIIKYRFNESQIDELLESQWWNFNPNDVFQNGPFPAGNKIKSDPYKFDSISIGGGLQ